LAVWLACFALAVPRPDLAAASAPADPADGWAVAVVPSDDPSLAVPVPRDQPLELAQVIDMVRRAVDLVGGMAAVVPDTARLVVIKPNIVMAAAPGSGIITDARVVHAVALLVHEAAPFARIVIGEAAGGWIDAEKGAAAGFRLPFWVRWLFDVARNGFETGGYAAVAAELRRGGLQIECVDLNFDRSVTRAVPGGGLAMPDYDLAATIVEADAWINCPVMKTHGTKITCALKNHIGLLPGNVYGFSKDRGTPHHPGIIHHAALIDELLVDLWTVGGVDLNVVDGIVGLEGGALGSGVPVRCNLVLAGRDAVATDLVAARLMGFDPADMEFAELARRRGAGPGTYERVQVRGSEVEPLVRRFRKAGRAYGRGDGGGWREYANYGMGPRYWTLLGPLEAAHQFSPAELAALDPVPGREGWSEAVFFHHDRIDLVPHLEQGAGGAAGAVYAFTRFTMARTDSVRLWVGSAGDLVVWIDGREAYRFAGRRPHRLGSERLPGYLAAGEHRLLVRAPSGSGPCEFSVNICEPIDAEDYAGNRYPGVRYYQRDYQRAAEERTASPAAPAPRRSR